MSVTLGITYNAQRLKEAVKDAESMGFDVMSAPSVGIDPGEDAAFSAFESASTDGATVVFTSTEAVEETAKRFTTKLSGMLSKCRVVVTEPSALRELSKHGVRDATQSSDVPADVSGGKVVLAGPSEETGPLAARMSGDVIQCAVCRIRDVGMGNGMFHMMIAIKRGRLDVLALTSPVAASDFMSSMKMQYGDEKAMEYMSKIKVVAMDAATAGRLEDAGRAPDMVSGKPDVHSMLLEIKGAFSESL